MTTKQTNKNTVLTIIFEDKVEAPDVVKVSIGSECALWFCIHTRTHTQYIETQQHTRATTSFMLFSHPPSRVFRKTRKISYRTKRRELIHHQNSGIRLGMSRYAWSATWRRFHKCADTHQTCRVWHTNCWWWSTEQKLVRLTALQFRTREYNCRYRFACTLDWQSPNRCNTLPRKRWA